MNYESQNKYWYLELESDNISGLQLDFTIIDDMDAAETRTYYIPAVPNVIDKVPNLSDSQYEDIVCNCSIPDSYLYAIKNNYEEDGVTFKNFYARYEGYALYQYTEHDYTRNCFY